jgi:hypothetical protein
MPAPLLGNSEALTPGLNGLTFIKASCARCSHLAGAWLPYSTAVHKDSARVTADALDALGRTEEAKALRERYGLASSDDRKPS